MQFYSAKGMLRIEKTKILRLAPYSTRHDRLWSKYDTKRNRRGLMPVYNVIIITIINKIAKQQ